MQGQFPYSRTSAASDRPNDRGGVPEWLKGTGCKPVGYAYVGSNPTLSTSPSKVSSWRNDIVESGPDAHAENWFRRV